MKSYYVNLNFDLFVYSSLCFFPQCYSYQFFMEICPHAPTCPLQGICQRHEFVERNLVQMKFRRLSGFKGNFNSY